MITDHIGCPKHIRNCEKRAKQRVADFELTQYFAKNITPENSGAFTKTRDVDMQVFNVKWVETLMKTATPVSKSDEFREFIGKTGYSLSTASNLPSLIPTILARMLMEIT